MLPTQPNQEKTFLYNPSKADFVWPFAGVDQTLPSRKITAFPKPIADLLAKHLAQKMTQEDGVGAGSQYEFNYNKHLQDIYVKL